jgi:hypothetical protein
LARHRLRTLWDQLARPYRLASLWPD